MLFQESIKRLVKVRRYVEKTNLEHLQDNRFMSAIADEVVVSLTLAIKDLARLDKVIDNDKEKLNELQKLQQH